MDGWIDRALDRWMYRRLGSGWMSVSVWVRKWASVNERLRGKNTNFCGNKAGWLHMWTRIDKSISITGMSAAASIYILNHTHVHIYDVAYIISCKWVMINIWKLIKYSANFHFFFCCYFKYRKVWRMLVKTWPCNNHSENNNNNQVKRVWKSAIVQLAKRSVLRVRLTMGREWRQEANIAMAYASGNK